MAGSKLSTGKIVGIIVAVVVFVLIVAGGIYCVSTDQNPVEAVQSVFSSNEEKIVGKWESQDSPGISAYVFDEDGNYDSYISTVNFSGTYSVKGNKLTLINPTTSKEVVYKFSISGNVLTLTLLEEDGREAEVNGEKDVIKYNKVDELNMKTLSDIIGEVAGEVTTTEASSDANE
ncbi:MAG: DUF5640 domain-containing protein [Eubacteriales bacterium]|nr:DUF5640 domain-containing protein [Eubacteriales bacterium]